MKMTYLQNNCVLVNHNELQSYI